MKNALSVAGARKTLDWPKVVTIREDHPLDSPIADVTALVHVREARFTLTVEPAERSDLFRIDDEGRVFLNEPLDADAAQGGPYLLKVVVRGHGACLPRGDRGRSFALPDYGPVWFFHHALDLLSATPSRSELVEYQIELMVQVQDVPITVPHNQFSVVLTDPTQTQVRIGTIVTQGDEPKGFRVTEVQDRDLFSIDPDGELYLVDAGRLNASEFHLDQGRLAMTYALPLAVNDGTTWFDFSAYITFVRDLAVAGGSMFDVLAQQASSLAAEPTLEELLYIAVPNTSEQSLQDMSRLQDISRSLQDISRVVTKGP
jgi:hypothetical protein